MMLLMATHSGTIFINFQNHISPHLMHKNSRVCNVTQMNVHTAKHEAGSGFCEQSCPDVDSYNNVHITVNQTAGLHTT